MAHWEWTDGGVKIGGAEFRWLVGNKSDLREFVDRMSSAYSTYLWLQDAERAFRTGSASYADAYANILTLLSEQRTARQEMGQAVREFDAFFDPPGVMRAVSETDLKILEQFLQEAMKRAQEIFKE